MRGTPLPEIVHHRLLLVVLLSILPSSVLAQSTSKIPWHVPQADVRYVVSVDPSWQTPVEYYLADLPASESKELAFDPKTKAAIPREIGEKASGKSILRVKGTSTFAVKPEYKWLTFRAAGKAAVSADQLALTPHVLPDKITHHVPIPIGARSLRIDVDSDSFTAAGFLTSGPKVARVVLCLPEHDPTQLVPLVYGDDGKQVGAVTLWAAAGEPMVVLFDSSAARPAYCVYPADKKHNLTRPEWTPQAGLIVETRYLENYDAKVKSLAGFHELWKQSDYVACKMEEGEVLRSFLPAPPRQSSQWLRSTPRGAPLALTRYIGHIRLPADDEYHFHFKAWQGGFLVVDGQPLIQLSPTAASGLMARGGNAHEVVGLKLSAGLHHVEIGQYGQSGLFLTSLGLSSATFKQPRILGQGGPIFEPIAGVQLKEFQSRAADKPVVRFAWPYRSDRPWRQCLGHWPAEDLVAWRFSAQLSGPADGIEFRWQFEDGRSAKGKEIDHIFCRMGTHRITLEAVDTATEKVVAKNSGSVHVQIRPDWPESHSFHFLVDGLKQRAGEFATTMPVNHLLSLHSWACQFRRQDLRMPVGDALAARLDEVVSRASEKNLLALARAFVEPEERRYPAAEKLLRAALARTAPGSHVQRQATLGLAELLSTVSGKAQESLDLLDKTLAQQPEPDLIAGWKVAFDPNQRNNLDKLPLAEVMGQLAWDSELKRLPIRYSSKGSEALWLAKEITLTAASTKQPLTLDFGAIASHTVAGSAPASGMVWFNNQPIGEPWRQPITLSEKLLREGANQVVVCVQAASAPEFFGNAAPTFDVLGAGRGEDLTPQLQRGRAEALAHLGKQGEAAKILENLPAKSWPLNEVERVRLLGQLRIIQRLALAGGDDALNAKDELDGLLSNWPLLRLDAEVMQARVETHLGLREFQQAFLLARQMLLVKEQGELTRRQFMLAQVRAAGELGDLDLARTIYKQLTDFSPYSPETVRAREAIIRAAERSPKK